MIESERGHRVGRPLDERSAEERALQAGALSSPVNLRVLSEIAAGSEPRLLEERLNIGSAYLRQAIDELKAVGLLDRGVLNELVLSADAWARFGRLFASSEHLGAPSRGTSIAALPPAVATVINDLAYRFQGTFSHETVAQYVVDSYLLLKRRAQVHTHLVALTARYASDRLEALASVQGLRFTAQPEVLFVCVHNAGRSQMAGAILRHLAGERVHVRTAGSSPIEDTHPRVAESLAEIGVTLWGEFPKPLTDEVVRAADFVVTMGCGDACPVFPGRRYLEWDLEDPLTLNDAGLRGVRDEIYRRVVNLLADMGQAVRL